MEAGNEGGPSCGQRDPRGAGGEIAGAVRAWKLHEPEIFAPWRAMDLARYQQGLPWDDTLVVMGLAMLDLGQEAVYALERRVESRRDILGAAGAQPAAIKELIFPLTGGVSRGSSSELGQTTMALIQKTAQLIAARVAEAEAAARGLGRTSRCRPWARRRRDRDSRSRASRARQSEDPVPVRFRTRLQRLLTTKTPGYDTIVT